MLLILVKESIISYFCYKLSYSNLFCSVRDSHYSYSNIVRLIKFKFIIFYFFFICVIIDFQKKNKISNSYFFKKIIYQK
jgi:hypothetical protein